MADLLRSGGAKFAPFTGTRKRGGNRLIAPGVGIDEDAALLVEDNRHAAVERTPVVVVDGRKESVALVVEFLRSGDAFDLDKRNGRSRGREKATGGSVDLGASRYWRSCYGLGPGGTPLPPSSKATCSGTDES
jgi:hypothetical protein